MSTACPRTPTRLLVGPGAQPGPRPDGRLLAAVHEDQLTHPTPCRDWNVQQLVTHVRPRPAAFLRWRAASRSTGRRPRAVTGDRLGRGVPVAADDLIHHWHQQGEDAGSARWTGTPPSSPSTPSTSPAAIGHGPAGSTPRWPSAAWPSCRSLTPENRGGAFGPARRRPRTRRSTSGWRRTPGAVAERRPSDRSPASGHAAGCAEVGLVPDPRSVSRAPARPGTAVSPGRRSRPPGRRRRGPGGPRRPRRTRPGRR